MSVLDLSEADWDLVFHLVERCEAQPRAEALTWLALQPVSEPVCAAARMQLELGEPPADPDRDRTHERVGERIELRRHLREGGAGVVYQGVYARDAEHVIVAVKMLRVPHEPAAREAVEGAWRREQALLREFSGLGTVPALLEAGEHRGSDGTPYLYLCMEYKYGLTLHRWCQEHALDPRARVELFLRVCEGVSAIHSHGLVHGDLKPDNIQIQAQGGVERVWILDLGLATIQGRFWGGQGRLVGTPGYMSPEQIREDLGAVRESADIYALGMILFELLEGRPWLDAGPITDPEELWRRIESRAPLELRSLPAGALRSELEAVLEVAVRLEPHDRYLHVSALCDALRKAIAREPRSATESSDSRAPAPQPWVEMPPDARDSPPCPRCRATTDPTRFSCLACGTELRWRCESCDEAQEASRRACSRCGKLRPGPREERKHVSVLIADLDPSPALLAEADPEEVARRIEPALDVIRSVVHRHQGTVRVIGDGAMALFGAPLALEDHAVRACLVAASIVQEVQRCAPDDLAIRVAVHSGEVLLRCIENDLSMDYDAIGDVPVIARGVQAQAGPGEIRITGDTFRLAEGYVQARPLGTTDVRGRAIEVLELLPGPAILSSWNVRSARGLTEFVERAQEVALFLESLHEAALGEVRVVEIVGEPGLGKSRLSHELARKAHALGWRIVGGTAHPTDVLDSYETLSRVLRTWLEVREQETQSDISARLERHLASTIPQHAQQYLPALQSLLDLPVRDAQWKELEPQQRRARIVAALRTLVAAAVDAQPFLFIIDDLHWADEQTLRTLETLARGARGRLVLLTSYRPDRPFVWDIPGTRRLALGPLSSDGGMQILDSLMGEDPSIQELKATLCEKADGNPLFLEESVRSLADRGVLRGEPGRFGFDGDLRSLYVPVSIRNVIASRVDRLERSLKITLQTAAIIGRQFSVEVLHQLPRRSRDTTQRDLAALAQLGFLYPDPVNPEGPYHFKHALIRDVVYESVPRSARSELHAAIVSAMEELYRERLTEHYSDLAEHAFLGRKWDAAAQYRLLACIAAQNRSASREAVDAFDRALETLEQMPQQRTIQKVSIDLRLVVSTALVQLGEHARLVRILNEAETLAKSLGDDRRMAAAHNQRALALWLSGESAQALEASARAGELALRLGNQNIYIASRYLAGQAHHARGEFRACIDAQTEVAKAYSGAALTDRTGYPGYPAVFACTFLLDSNLQLGLIDAARAHAAEGIALCDRLGHAYSRTMLDLSVGMLLLEEQRAEEAVAMLEGTLALCLEHEVVTMQPSISARLALAQVHVGQLDAAEHTLRAVLGTDVRERTALYNWIEIARTAAELRLRQGRLDEASRFAAQAQALCNEGSALGQLAHVLDARARIELARGGEAHGNAVAIGRQALELTAKLEMTPLHDRLLRLTSG